MPQSDEYLSLLRKIQSQLNQLRELNGKADLDNLLAEIAKCNQKAEEHGYSEPFPERLIKEIEAMQKRLQYYYETGVDAPSITGEFTGP